MSTVISHDPYTDTFQIHFSNGRNVIMERNELEQLSRVLDMALKPVDGNWRQRLEQAYGMTPQGDLS